MVKIKKPIGETTHYSRILFELAKSPSNSYQLAQKLGQNPSSVWRKFQRLIDENFLSCIESAKNIYEPNYSVLQRHFVDFSIKKYSEEVNELIENIDQFNFETQEEKNSLINDLNNENKKTQLNKILNSLDIKIILQKSMLVQVKREITLLDYFKELRYTMFQTDLDEFNDYSEVQQFIKTYPSLFFSTTYASLKCPFLHRKRTISGTTQPVLYKRTS